MERAGIRVAGLLVLAFRASALRAQALPTPPTWTVPGIVNAAGRNNTRFVSDLALTNPGSKSTGIYISFVPEGVVPDQDVTLGAGQTIVWRNVLQQLWGGVETSGAAVITSDYPLLIRARTYNTASTGTYGVALPAVPDEDLLSEGDRADCLWISQSADGAKDYRTNLAVAFPDAGGGVAEVTLFDGNGTNVGSWEFSSDTGGFQQVSVGKIVGSLPVGRAEIEIVSGRAVAYSAVVDNVTGDSSLFRFEALPAGPQDVLANGVARANGKNNTFFRTDGRFFNPGSADVTVTAAFHASGASNPSPATTSFAVPAGKLLDVTDVLGTLLGLPVGSAGAVRFRSDSPVGILCRTSNVDPTGAVPGTFGAQQRPVPILSFLMSADAGALITGVRQSPDPNTGYRTNIAVAAGADGATVQFTLRSSQAVSAGTATQTLGPWGWQQTAVDKLFAGTAVPGDAQVLVKVTQGSADVYDASVDNASGDSVVTPAPALPVTIPSSATIGPEGGSVQSSDGRLTLKIPAGSLASPSNVSLVPSAGTVTGGLGPAYTLSVDGSSFAAPPIAVFRYGPGDLEGTDADSLGLAFQSGGTLYGLPGTSCDAAARTLSVRLDGIPAAPVRSSPRRPLTIFHIDIDPIVYLRITPGEVAVPTSGTVPFELTGLERPTFQSGTGNPALRPIDFSTVSLGWVLKGATDPGTVSQSGPSSLRYTAPAKADCGTVITLAVDANRSGQKYSSDKVVRISVVPRNWRLRVSVFAKVNLCQGALSLSFPSDTYQLNLSLRDDMTFFPAGPGNPGDQGSDLHDQVVFGWQWCPNSGCTCDWTRQPSHELQFFMSSGGWDRGQFFFDIWGLNLNGNGFQQFSWNCQCKTGSQPGSYLLPNIAGTPQTTKRLLLYGPRSTASGCTVSRTFTFQDFEKMSGIRPRSKGVYNGTEYSLVMEPVN